MSNFNIMYRFIFSLLIFSIISCESKSIERLERVPENYCNTYYQVSDNIIQGLESPGIVKLNKKSIMFIWDENEDYSFSVKSKEDLKKIEFEKIKNTFYDETYLKIYFGDEGVLSLQTSSDGYYYFYEISKHFASGPDIDDDSLSLPLWGNAKFTDEDYLQLGFD